MLLIEAFTYRKMQEEKVGKCRDMWEDILLEEVFMSHPSYDTSLLKIYLNTFDLSIAFSDAWYCNFFGFSQILTTIITIVGIKTTIELCLMTAVPCRFFTMWAKSCVKCRQILVNPPFTVMQFVHFLYSSFLLLPLVLLMVFLGILSFV